MGLPEYEAYNQTRGCFLGVDIVAGEFVHVARMRWLPELRSGSGAGLWMKPFRGIRSEEAQIPIDLLYLDEECRVIEAIECFPTSSVTHLGDNVASVLALPSDSIHSSQTKAGDQLIICPPEKMAAQRKQLSHSGADAGAAPSAISSTTTNPIHFGEGLPVTGPLDPMQLKDRPTDQAAVGRKGNWLRRWLHLDPLNRRGASQEPTPGLTACFWTGGSPEVHEIREISTQGMYVVTDERWYPGTIIQITIARPDAQETQSRRSISVIGKAVRSGNDGVEFEFVLRNGLDKKLAKTLPADPVDRKELGRFLK